MFLFLSENDLQKIRAGASLFVDKRATQGHLFDHVIIGYGRTDAESIKMIESVGKKLDPVTMQVHNEEPGEVRCGGGCDGIMSPDLLLEGKCIVCWSTAAKKLQALAG